MSWTIVNNCHVRVWIAAPTGVIPPAGAPTFDGLCQHLTPVKRLDKWVQRFVFSPTLLPNGPQLLSPGGTTTYLAIVDDATTAVLGWYVLFDADFSTTPGPGPGQFQADAVFCLAWAVDQNGVPCCENVQGGGLTVARLTLTNQGADVNNMTVYTPAANGIFRISFCAYASVLDPASSTLQLQMSWTDPSGQLDTTGGFGNPSLQFMSAAQGTPFTFAAAAGTPIQISLATGAPYFSSLWSASMLLEQIG